eukprot:CAMPEP_0184859826 /NCGR_PEP_ID=MMETSP0580-20130426/4805_1 /TAXON_ID=1118495 /ORGANISM="Dactyliosolen fragilissimus" /LENGTH=620 /DNA_ID=CAMNT_0027356671 /DNA_START=56 /DNA_END=1918 /DNA_ORIENTATION=+
MTLKSVLPFRNGLCFNPYRLALDICIVSLMMCGYLTSISLKKDEGIDSICSVAKYLNLNENNDNFMIYVFKQFLNFLDIHITLLASSCLLTLGAPGHPLDRWTISLPQCSFVLLQIFHRTIVTYYSETEIADILFLNWVDRLTLVSSLVCIFLAAVLSFLFQPVELPPIDFLENGNNISEKTGSKKQIYPIGTARLHIPIRNTSESKISKSIPVRILYPISETQGGKSGSQRTPYLPPSISLKLCEAHMKLAPPPFNNMAPFMLNQWRLITIPAKENAMPLNITSSDEKDDVNQGKDVNKKNRLVIFSHGLTGCASTYSYTCMSLASAGYLVVQIEHGDGSSIGYENAEGSFVEYETKIHEMSLIKGRKPESVRCRRERCNFRANEFISVTESLLMWDQLKEVHNMKNDHVLNQVMHKFTNSIDRSFVIAAGHSFGGGTALASASKRPDLYKAVVAHDAAADWMPDFARRDLMRPEKLIKSGCEYDGGEGGWSTPAKIENPQNEKKKSDITIQDDTNLYGKNVTDKSSLHDLPLQFQWSRDWLNKGWAISKQIKKMHEADVLGCKNSDVCVVTEQHSEFSDVCMLTPLWLARSTGLTGPRNPIETAREVAKRSIEFLNKL